MNIRTRFFKWTARFVFPCLFMLPLALPASAETAKTAEQGEITWQGWEKDLFQKAKNENRFVILDLAAVWCHWCHVMEETTYKDPKVVELIKSKYIPVRVDQDSHPDLSSRYEDYGWPATIIFAPDGHELAKRRGYIQPEALSSLLQAVIDDPTPGPSVREQEEIVPSKDAFLTPEQKKAVFDEHFSLYDKQNGGWGNVLKLIDPDQMEYALLKALEGDSQETAMAKQTLDASLNLIDPEWGGIFQYSDEVNWKSPHYEKIMNMQAYHIRLYALAYLIFKEQKSHGLEYLEGAKAISKYLKNFLTDAGGAFYTSQDADVSPLIPGRAYYTLKDADRRKLGMPNIDKHIYSRENGWAIQALLALYAADPQPETLQRAVHAARWIMQNRRLPEGGFRHDEKDQGGPYLGDSLSMARAFLALYMTTAERSWLQEARTTADYIDKNFRDPQESGFTASQTQTADSGVFQKPVKQFDENVALARFANLLFYYTGDQKYKDMAASAMKYLASPALLKNRRFLVGALLADMEINTEPDHITITGKKDDPAAKDLFLAGLAYPSVYKRLEWWDRREGALPNPDVDYPQLPKAAAFACANHICSLPSFTPDKLAKQVERLKGKKSKTA